MMSPKKSKKQPMQLSWNRNKKTSTKKEQTMAQSVLALQIREMLEKESPLSDVEIAKRLSCLPITVRSSIVLIDSVVRIAKLKMGERSNVRRYEHSVFSESYDYIPPPPPKEPKPLPKKKTRKEKSPTNEGATNEGATNEGTVDKPIQ